MTQLQMIRIASEMVKEGKNNAEIRKSLFNLKGAKVSQIRAVMTLLEDVSGKGN